MYTNTIKYVEMQREIVRFFTNAIWLFEECVYLIFNAFHVPTDEELLDNLLQTKNDKVNFEKAVDRVKENGGKEELLKLDSGKTIKIWY